jgi:hypothetical protein
MKIKPRPDVKKRWWYNSVVDIIKTLGASAIALLFKKK